MKGQGMRLRNFGCLAPLAGAVLALGAVSSLQGCSGGGGGGSNVFSQLVMALTGGTVSTGTVGISIPPNALAADTTITIQQGGTTPAAPSGMQIIPNSTFTFGPAGTQFSSPVTVTISYSQSDLNGSPEASLVLGHVTQNGFDIIQGQVNANNNTFTGQINSFSVYCLLGQKPQLNPAAFAGNWTGQWHNTTFGSQNNITMSVAVNESNRTSTTTMRVFGEVLGTFNSPPAETYNGSWTDTEFTINTTSTIFGAATLSINQNGTLTGHANTTSNTRVSSVDLTGTVTSTQINANYTVHFRDNTTATGTITLTKS
jgi:hypothetical protein